MIKQMRRLLRMYLERESYAVDEAEDSVTAYQKALAIHTI